MPTKKPRIIITMDQCTLDKLELYRAKNNFSSMSQAAYSLLQSALLSENASAIPSKGNALAITGDELALLKSFRHTTPDGRDTLRACALSVPSVRDRSLWSENLHQANMPLTELLDQLSATQDYQSELLANIRAIDSASDFRKN